MRVRSASTATRRGRWRSPAPCAPRSRRRWSASTTSPGDVVRVLPMGPRSVLVEGIGDDPAAWAAGLARTSPGGIVEIVPAAETVLVVCADAGSLARVREQLAAVRPVAPLGRAAGPPVEVAVRYDGEDLEHVAGTTGLSIEEVVA